MDFFDALHLTVSVMLLTIAHAFPISWRTSANTLRSVRGCFDLLVGFDLRGLHARNTGPWGLPSRVVMLITGFILVGFTPFVANGQPKTAMADEATPTASADTRAHLPGSLSAVHPVAVLASRYRSDLECTRTASRGASSSQRSMDLIAERDRRQPIVANLFPSALSRSQTNAVRAEFFERSKRSLVRRSFRPGISRQDFVWAEAVSAARAEAASSEQMIARLDRLNETISLSSLTAPRKLASQNAIPPESSQERIARLDAEGTSRFESLLEQTKSGQLNPINPTRTAQ